MNSPFSQKVVLKSTTKVSLNERFTNMLRNKQPVPVNIRATMQQQHLASARNRRLAQQMEHRPSVQAALQDKQCAAGTLSGCTSSSASCTQSLKQRLGKSNIHARLGQPMGALRGGATGWGFTMGRLRGTTRGSIRGGRGGTMRGAISLQGMQMRRRGGHTLLVMQRGGLVGNGGGALIGRGVRGGFRGKILWGCDGFGGRGRGRGLGKGAGRPTVTREQLDNQLDAYMSKTKGHLDAELEAYMAQTDLEGME